MAKTSEKQVEETEKVETTTEAAVTKTALETTETVTTETAVTETAPEAEEKVDPDFQAEAEKHMKAQNVKEIWRCPVKGYWFTKPEYAQENAKKVDKSPEHYKL